MRQAHCGHDGAAALIGVIVRPEQKAIVGEFFELFKTPWEFHRPGRFYDVVLAAGELPEVKTKLLIIYSSERIAFDGSNRLETGSKLNRGSLIWDDKNVPLYRGLLPFVTYAEGVSCLASRAGSAGVVFSEQNPRVIRAGFSLFEEVAFLVGEGQPVEQAQIPTLDLHIDILRRWILRAGISLVEIGPSPAGYEFTVCLTHDIDFTGIRNHRFDHSMWGFVYRAGAGSILNLVRGRISPARLFQNWRAVASLPFVYLGWARDFWAPFAWYLEAEKELPATYFLIPFKKRAGEKVPGRRAARRAAQYDVSELSDWTEVLLRSGCEIGVHGIDAWHSAERGREELGRVSGATGNQQTGIRMHWLLRDELTAATLEQAGFSYDSTVGYNEAVGYRAGTKQVYRSPGAEKMLELPLHIQDGALFFPQRMNLSECNAAEVCQRMIDNARKSGGVLTVLWHDRSHGPERFWGDFYLGLIKSLRELKVWFATGSQAVDWFRTRRGVRFEVDESLGDTDIQIHSEQVEIHPPLSIRIYRPERPGEHGGARVLASFAEIPWTGESPKYVALEIAARSELASGIPL